MASFTYVQRIRIGLASGEWRQYSKTREQQSAMNFFAFFLYICKYICTNIGGRIYILVLSIVVENVLDWTKWPPTKCLKDFQIFFAVLSFSVVVFV